MQHLVANERPSFSEIRQCKSEVTPKRDVSSISQPSNCSSMQNI